MNMQAYAYIFKRKGTIVFGGTRSEETGNIQGGIAIDRLSKSLGQKNS